MIRVIIELLPGGKEAGKTLLGVMRIANVGGTVTHGNYDVTLSKRGQNAKQTWRRTHIEGFKRRQFGAYDLLCLSLMFALKDRLNNLLLPGSQEGQPQISLTQQRIDAVKGAISAGAGTKDLLAQNILTALDAVDLEPAQMAMTEGD